MCQNMSWDERKQEHISYQDIPVFGQDLTRQQRLEAMVWPMIHWYGHHARALPWREQISAYRTWISEIMLQQTRVEAVKPYFARFLSRLPDVEALANVPEEELLKLWEGLGYYSRARNLKRCAIQVMEEYDGALPSDYQELLGLPGIGSYTAGAIASIAYGKSVPAVDGNVMRVLTRLLADDRDITKGAFKKELERELAELLICGAEKKEIPPGIFNQALMEIGATVCVPNGVPLCEACPLRGICLAKQEGSWEQYPVKAAKKPRRAEQRTVFRVQTEDGYYIRKRPARGLLANLYEFPNVEGIWTEEQARAVWEKNTGTWVSVKSLGTAKHVFTHIEWQMMGYEIKLSGEPKGPLIWEKETLQYFSREFFLKQAAIPSAFRNYMPK